MAVLSMVLAVYIPPPQPPGPGQALHSDVLGCHRGSIFPCNFKHRNQVNVLFPSDFRCSGSHHRQKIAGVIHIGNHGTRLILVPTTDSNRAYIVTSHSCLNWVLWYHEMSKRNTRRSRLRPLVIVPNCMGPDCHSCTFFANFPNRWWIRVVFVGQSLHNRWTGTCLSYQSFWKHYAVGGDFTILS